MVWFWKKKQADANTYGDMNGTTTRDPATAEAAVEAAVANAQHSDKEWRRQAARLRQEEKRRERQLAKAAKRDMAIMKKQARAARKARAKAEKLIKKQASAVLKVQKREVKAERKRVKAIATLHRTNEKRRKRLVRKRQKEERRRRKRLQIIDADIVPLDHEVAVATETEPTATTVPLEAPSFKEAQRCKSCSSQFQRLPTRRRHHCRNCGESFCSKCLSSVKRPIPWFQLDKPQKVCFSCDVHVFNGMGGLASRPDRAETSAATVPSPSLLTASPVDAALVQPSSAHQSSLRAQRSGSFQSEQPEDSPRTEASPTLRHGLSFRRRPRSRRDTNSSKSKKNSRWALPIRPLLKRKASADQLRNRTWDLDLRIEKEEMLARQRQSQMIVVTGAPQFATAS